MIAVEDLLVQGLPILIANQLLNFRPKALARCRSLGLLISDSSPSIGIFSYFPLRLQSLLLLVLPPIGN